VSTLSNILYEAEDGIALITLNRPEKLNAFAGTMREELLARLEEASQDRSVRSLVITGAGRAFCSGGDVDFMAGLQKQGDEASFSRLLAAGGSIVLAIRNMDKPVIAAINGVAAGAGCNLALACDYRIAAREAKLGQTFVRIGLNPDWGGTFFLPRLVGPGRAMEIMMTGRMVEAEEAFRIGMVDQLVQGDSVLEASRDLASAFAAAAPLPVAAIKRAVYASVENDLERQIAMESDFQLAAFRSSDAAEGMAAFFEKRKPRFTGN
jgi:enoyl-CoA hydratase/carnithine racemase